ncbi:nicotinate-nucleotide--dimethylbenzimidazole phosphoribosyltransferase [Rheinheimera sp.]|uniref:nicotinate-nucleotide--dimethylbenzimidazole phosphoribosyltransferase n=1 Tax=Rheinheimera sp. TaxID=1869214 RepID=UPI00307F3C76
MKFEISVLDHSKTNTLQQVIDQKTKPLGALGKLENLALQLALIQQSLPLKLQSPLLLIFAGDHGINRHQLSIAPSQVTTEMVRNFLAGGAAANCFCRSAGVALKVVDCGILTDLPEQPGLIKQRLGAGTDDFSLQRAMSPQQAQQGLELGYQLARQQLQSGYDVLLLGEMGIANTSSAAALLCAATDIPLYSCVGFGTGISPEQYQRKVSLIQLALSRPYAKDPVSLLAEFGGFEIAQLTGAILGGASQRSPVLIDGFIVTVAAILACQLNPACRDYLIFAHQGAETGHRAALTQLQASPLLDLSLRLGEGTGAVLAWPLLQAAQSFFNDMASFQSAAVTNVVQP